MISETDLIHQKIPEDARGIKIESKNSHQSDLKVLEYEDDKSTYSYLEVDEFNNMIGYTLKDICKWLDNRYETDFQSTRIDSFEYGNGYIMLSREKT